MSPRKVVSASAGMSGSRTPSSPATGSSPYQVRRTGHPASSAVRLNRSWLRNAHTTPQWSRNQSQSRSNPGPAGARSGDSCERPTRSRRKPTPRTPKRGPVARPASPPGSGPGIPGVAPAPDRRLPCRTGSANNSSLPRRRAGHRKSSTESQDGPGSRRAAGAFARLPPAMGS